MEQKLIEIIVQYIPAIFILIGYVLIKYGSPFIKWIKDTFGTKKTGSSGNNININLDTSQNQTSSNAIFNSLDYSYVLTILLHHAKILRAMGAIKGDILHEQMEYFRKMIRPIKIGYTEIVCELLNEAGIENIYFGAYFTNSENFIEVCGHHIEATFRQMCKANHFTEKTNNEFKEVVETNIIIIDGLLNELLMKRYPQRQLLKDMKKFDCLREDLRDALKEAFERAREVAVEKETKLDSAKEEFELNIYKLTGTKYKLEL